MSHETVIADLKGLIKTSLISIDPIEHTRHIRKESDRVSILLSASMIEEALVHAIQVTMSSELNSDERKRIFDFEGPLGSFANKIRFAQAFGHIDRPMRRKIEVVKEIRNAAAHSHEPITFDTPAVRTAVRTLDHHASMNDWTSGTLRFFFELYCTMTTAKIA